MAATCANLVKKYSVPLPEKTASVEEKQKWLHVQTWTCIPPTTTMNPKPLENPAECESEKVNNLNQTDSKVNIAVRPPIYNKLLESGFMDFVNQRGLQCINKLTGRFLGLNTATGSVNEPSVDVLAKDAVCGALCNNVTSGSEMCFQCIVEFLTDKNQPENAQECPQAAPTIADFQEAVNCQLCLGYQAFTAPAASDTAKDNANQIENSWECLVGTVNTDGISLEFIIGMVIVGILVFLTAIILLIYFFAIHPKVKQANQEREALTSRNIDIDSI